ncbi:MAG: aminodeoxychorismate/anthranilate synthase component II [Chloroflexota bacterium]
MNERILLIDNYDSFTYNLYQFMSELGADVTVVRNDAITVDEVVAFKADGIVLSPGPGRPENAGICVAVIHRLAGAVPLLGVCLGHQAMAHAYGGNVIGAPELRHGKASLVHHDGQGVYAGLPNPFSAIRYHSLMAERETLPAEFLIDSWTDDGIIMGMRHRELPIYGVQFHPESILTEAGKDLLANFLAIARGERVAIPAIAGR